MDVTNLVLIVDLLDLTIAKIVWMDFSYQEINVINVIVLVKHVLTYILVHLVLINITYRADIVIHVHIHASIVKQKHSVTHAVTILNTEINHLVVHVLKISMILDMVVLNVFNHVKHAQLLQSFLVLLVLMDISYKEVCVFSVQLHVIHVAVQQFAFNVLMVIIYKESLAIVVNTLV
jgi:hypothetical protein